MFTGFASENTPAIQVWDFFQTFASTTATRSVSLADDCAPIQVFRTGATSSGFIRVYLPTAPIEGKQITIVNQQYGNSNQNIVITSPDTSNNGASFALFTMGQGDSIVLVYSKQNITYGPITGAAQTGWIALNKCSPTAANNYSAIVGGNSNSTLASHCFIGGGEGNSATTSHSAVLGGSSNTAGNNYSVVLGGTSNFTTGNGSVVVGGVSNSANSTYSVVAGGTYGTTRSIIGNFVTSASSFPITPSSGRQQLATLLLGRQTTDATATVLASTTSVAGTTNQVILPNNSAYYFRGSVISNVTGGGATKAWTFEGAIKRGANAASTTIVQSVLNPVASDTAAESWLVALSADTTNGGLAVTVTGAASTTIRWVCKIETTEVTF